MRVKKRAFDDLFDFWTTAVENATHGQKAEILSDGNKDSFPVYAIEEARSYGHRYVDAKSNGSAWENSPQAAHFLIDDFSDKARLVRAILSSEENRENGRNNGLKIIKEQTVQRWLENS